jgi:hypothetical protein
MSHAWPFDTLTARSSRNPPGVIGETAPTLTRREKIQLPLERHDTREKVELDELRIYDEVAGFCHRT